MGLFDRFYKKQELVRFSKEKAKVNYEYVLLKEKELPYPSFYVEQDSDPYNKDMNRYQTSQYLWSLFRQSNILMTIYRPKDFFEALEEFESLLYDYKNYKFMKNINMSYEVERYEDIKYGFIKDFIDNAFRNEFRNAIELKTEKGRINHIDHWFLVMNYYKQYMDISCVNELDALHDKWNTELVSDMKI